MKYKFEKVSSKFGAPMGRWNSMLPEFDGIKARLSRVKLDSGGYDAGGAYWGHGLPLYVCWGENEADEVQYFIRAKDRQEAKQFFIGRLESIRFYW